MTSLSQAGKNVEIMDLTPDNIADYGICGYKDVKKHLELRRKVDWYRKYYDKGLRIKALISGNGGYQGMIEYIPGRYAHRPVYAEDYMFIHCLFVGFKKEFKGRGFGSLMVDTCIEESRKSGLKGVAVVTRKGSFMATKDIFIKKGFAQVDRAKPDFELLALKFDPRAADPRFTEVSPEKYPKGLTVIRCAQCPYSVKNVDAILKTAEKMKIPAGLLELESAEMARQVPSAFGTFCIIYEGKVISHHPISNTRFENIMRSLEAKKK